MGEANEGHASLVQVELHDDALAVEDNGRGIPVEGTKLGKSTLELIFTTLHGCNCGCDQPPGHRNGDQGLGVAIVNALSAWLEVETVRDGQLYRMEFKQGRVTLPLEARGPADRLGTRVTFSPDRSIFGPEPVFDTPWLHDHVRGLSGIPGAQLTLTSA